MPNIRFYKYSEKLSNSPPTHKKLSDRYDKNNSC